MRKVNLGQVMPGPSHGAMDWLVRSLREIEQASAEENPCEIFDAYTIIQPPGGLVPVRTFDPATATAGDIAAFLATIVLDMQRRGQRRDE